MQPTFLFRTKRTGPVFQSHDADDREKGDPSWRRLHISFKPIHVRLHGFLEDSGRRDRSTLYIWRQGAVQHSVYVRASAAGLKTAMRRLRAQEAEKLDDLDRSIQHHQQAIKALREERDRVLRDAWQVANVVRLSEVLDDAEAEAERAKHRKD
jgi:hypothetical protein